MRKLAVMGLVAALVSGVAMMGAAKHVQHGKAAGARKALRGNCGGYGCCRFLTIPESLDLSAVQRDAFTEVTEKNRSAVSALQSERQQARETIQELLDAENVDLDEVRKHLEADARASVDMQLGCIAAALEIKKILTKDQLQAIGGVLGCPGSGDKAQAVGQGRGCRGGCCRGGQAARAPGSCSSEDKSKSCHQDAAGCARCGGCAPRK